VENNTITMLNGKKDVLIEEVAAPTMELEVPEEVTVEEAIADADNDGFIESFDTTDRTPIEVSLKKGDKEYSNVRIVIENATEGLQLIAQDTNGNWYDIVKAGWGPKEGFALQDAKTEVYVVASTSGEKSVTVQLVDMNDNSKVLAEVTRETVANAITLAQPIAATEILPATEESVPAVELQPAEEATDAVEATEAE
ncbi:MAG: hypothetical protein ACLUKQ_06520, partial [Peptococcaceae bacterium]